MGGRLQSVGVGWAVPLASVAAPMAVELSPVALVYEPVAKEL